MKDKPSINKEYAEASDEEILYLIWTANPNRKALKELHQRIDANSFSVSLDVIFAFLKSLVITGGCSKWEREMYAKITGWVGQRAMVMDDSELAGAIIRHSGLRDGIFIFEDLLSFLNDERIANIISKIKDDIRVSWWDFDGMLRTIKEFKAARLKKNEP